jgi:hypothetical protein
MRHSKIAPRGRPGAEGFMAFQPREPLARRRQFDRRGESRPEQAEMQTIERKAAVKADNLPTEKAQPPSD